MENLTHATSDLIDALNHEGFSPDLLAEIADEWDVAAPLLTRSFTHRTGKAPEEYSGTVVKTDYEAIYKTRGLGCPPWRSLTPAQKKYVQETADRYIAKGTVHWNFVFGR